jgi:hypothetical protein
VKGDLQGAKNQAEEGLGMNVLEFGYHNYSILSCYFSEIVHHSSADSLCLTFIFPDTEIVILSLLNFVIIQFTT